MPAGFIDIVINILGFHYADNVIGIKDTVAIGVGLIVPLYPTLNIILGNIEPEAYSLGIFKHDCVTINAKSDPSVLLRVRILGRQTVSLKTHGIVAVVNLSVCPVRQ